MNPRPIRRHAAIWSDQRKEQRPAHRQYCLRSPAPECSVIGQCSYRRSLREGVSMSIKTPGVTAPEAGLTVRYEDRCVPARPGSSIAAALTAADIRVCRQSAAGDRGLFCGMGVCGECSIEVDVVGGGPAGPAAPAPAAEAGADVLLVDERASLGGQYYKQPASSFVLDPAALDRQYSAGRELIQRVGPAPVRFFGGVGIWGADGPARLYAARGR